MREEDEARFDAYASARWASLVRVIALLGTPDHLAPQVARATLARTRAEWAGRDAIDPDLAMCQALLSERRLADRWWVASDQRAVKDETRLDLESRLDTIGVDERLAVLVHALLGVDAIGSRTSPTSEAQIRDVADTIPVVPLDSGSVARAAQDQSRARLRRTVVPVGVVAAAVLIGTVVLGPGGEGGDVDASVPRATDAFTIGQARADRTSFEAIANPAPVPWYAEGVLHLEQTALEVPIVRRAAELGNGAVVLTYSGELALLDDVGTRTRLADLAGLGEGASFVVSDEDSLVAWVEKEPQPDPLDERPLTLIVHDTTRRIDLLRMLVDPQSTPVAVDSRAVYFNQEGQSVRIALGREEYVEAPRADDIEIDPRPLVAAAGATRVYQVAEGRLEVEQTYRRQVLELPGVGGEVSDDGAYLATRTFGPGSSAYGDARVFELRGGQELERGTDRRTQVAIDVELGPDDTVSYLVADVGPDADGEVESLDLVTCFLSERYLRFAIAAGENPPDRCSVSVRIPTSGVATFLGQ